MENVIKKDANAALTTVEKTRFSTASEHFLKGAETFLMNYNLQIQGIVDVEKMKKQHQEVLDEKIEKVQGKEQQSQKVQKKSGSILKVALLTSAVATLMIPQWRSYIFNLITNIRENNRNFKNLINSGKNILKNVFGILGTYGKIVLVQLGIMYDRLVGQIVLPLFFKVVQLFDFLLNGESYMVSYNVKVNIFQHLFQQVVYKIFDILVQKSSFFKMLEMFGLSIYKHANMRPKLVQFLRYNSRELMEALSGQAESGQGAFESSTVQEKKGFFRVYYQSKEIPARQKWASTHKKNKGQNPIEGKSSDGYMGWEQISPIMAQYLRQIYDVQGVEFIQFFENGGSFQIAYYDSSKPWIKNTSKRWEAIEDTLIDYEDDTDETELRFLKYTDLAHLKQILENIGSSIEDLPIAMHGTKMYESIVSEYNDFYDYFYGLNGMMDFEGVTVQIYGELLFLGLVTEVVYYQWYMSKEQSELWNEINAQNKNLVKIYRDKSQQYVKHFKIITNVQHLDVMMTNSRINFTIYKEKLNHIFTQWSIGNDMFPSLNVRPDFLYKKINYKRIIDIVYFLGRQFENLKIAIELKKQDVNSFNFVDYNINKGFNQEYSDEQEALFNEDNTLSENCNEIIRNFFQSRENEIKLRKKRNERLSELLVYIKRCKDSQTLNEQNTKEERKARREKRRQIKNKYAVASKKQEVAKNWLEHVKKEKEKAEAEELAKKTAPKFQFNSVRTIGGPGMTP